MPDEECEKLKADKTKDGIARGRRRPRRKVTRVLPGGSDPETFDISQDGTTLFVSNEDAARASIVDVASGKVRSTVPVGREPEGVRLHPDGKTVWVTGETDHDVTVLDTETGKVVGQIEVGKRPRVARLHADGARAYVTSEVDGTVWVRGRRPHEGAQDDHDARGLEADGRRRPRPTASGSTSRTAAAARCR